MKTISNMYYIYPTVALMLISCSTKKIIAYPLDGIHSIKWDQSGELIYSTKFVIPSMSEEQIRGRSDVYLIQKNCRNGLGNDPVAFLDNIDKTKRGNYIYTFIFNTDTPMVKQNRTPEKICLSVYVGRGYNFSRFESEPSTLVFSNSGDTIPN